MQKNIPNIIAPSTIVLLTACTFISSLTPIPSHPISLTGAGASLPALLYVTWFNEFTKKYPNVKITYQAVGSGAGIEEFTKGKVDFGASDNAITDKQIALVKRGVITLPLTANALVIVYNVPGVGNLKLPRLVYTDIFLGNIKDWNDPAIIKANPGVNFPKLPITVVYRSDGSILTQILTRHLSAISQEWRNKIGSGKNVKWLTGIGAKGAGSPSEQIPQTPGSIGYLEYSLATENNFKMATLENKAGQFIEPTINSFTQALNSVKLPDNLRIFITDPNGAKSYPIVASTWLLVYKKYNEPEQATTLKYLLNWSLTEGQKIAPILGYVPLPAKVINQVQEKVNQTL